MELDKNLKILIVGLGLIGGSYAEALTAKGYEVGAIARREETLRYALEKGLINHGETSVREEYIAKFDLIVFALYPHIFIEWIEKYEQYFKPGAILTDVTGVKGGVVEKVQSMLRDDVEFIGAHPMAGRELSGVENATRKIFRNANYIVTPTEKNTKHAIKVCRALGRTLGFKTVTSLPPEKHDEMIAFLSQLTHCIAISLMTCRDTACLAEYSGDSFRDLTRIAKINDEMWSELFLMNKEQLLCQMDLFIDKISNLRDNIAQDKKEEMREMMRLSTSQRLQFDMKDKKETKEERK